MNTNKLKSARVANGFTQVEVASKLKMTPKTYNRKELGATEFTNIEILNLSTLLGLTINKVNEIFFENKLTD